ncbi:MAG: DUF362 domain-containing protein [Planctomycetota bacterium]|jgi:uncharacterized Fe-S center protein
MASRVYFHDARSGPQKGRVDKVRDLFKHAGFETLIAEGDQVAVKVHWGEHGNVGFVAPQYVRAVVDLIRKAGGLPFITDTNTLYGGMRRKTVDNLMCAALNGFTEQTVGAPVIVADGVKGRDGREIEVRDSRVGKAKIATGILDADAMIVISHVKGHMLFGFGGALKNVGMGCATPAGKQALHSDVRPKVVPEKCKADGICIRHCPEECIALVDGAGGGKVALIDEKKCVGCGECTAACPHGAIPINWETAPDVIMQKTAEYAWAALKDKPKKAGYINFIIQVTPDCDCCSWDDTPIVPDIGFAASKDPVALDAASAELVAKAPVLPMSRAEGAKGDPWRVCGDVDYVPFLAHAERLGLGRRDYELVRLKSG